MAIWSALSILRTDVLGSYASRSVDGISTQVISDMSFATESEWAQVIGETRYGELRSALCELVAYASPVEEALLRK